jgi:hypothetical protein
MATRNAGSRLETVPRRAQALAHLATQAVARIGPVDGDDGDAVIAHIEEYGIAHQNPRCCDGMGRPLQFFAEIRMGDGDQAARALGECLSPEFRGAEFRDDHVDLAARGGDRSREPDRDAAELVPFRGRGQRDDRMPAGRSGAGAHEVHLPAGAAHISPSRSVPH